MPIPSSSNRGVLGRIGSSQASVAASAGQSAAPSAFITATAVPPVGWLGIFGTGRYLTFLESGTFTAPLSGYYRVRVLGGGGSGAATRTYNNTTDINVIGKRATGGGGGGYALGLVWLTQGQTVSMTVGRGGASGAINQPGLAGGLSSFGTYLSATGGAGGTFADSGALGAAAGGAGVGGSLINAIGGRSGAIDANLGTSATGGGGAASQLGNGGEAGSVSGGGGSTAATGGGGVGGVPSGSIVRGQTYTTGGAGVAGPSNAAVGGFDLLSVGAIGNVNGAVNSSSAVFRFPGDGFAGGGGPGNVNNSNVGAGGTGAGGGASVSTNNPGAGGIFGGSGSYASSESNASALKPGFGGGGGGVVAYYNGTSLGGDGLVVVEW